MRFSNLFPTSIAGRWESSVQTEFDQCQKLLGNDDLTRPLASAKGLLSELWLAQLLMVAPVEPSAPPVIVRVAPHIPPSELGPHEKLLKRIEKNGGLRDLSSKDGWEASVLQAARDVTLHLSRNFPDPDLVQWTKGRLTMVEGQFGLFLEQFLRTRSGNEQRRQVYRLYHLASLLDCEDWFSQQVDPIATQQLELAFSRSRWEDSRQQAQTMLEGQSKVDALPGLKKQFKSLDSKKSDPLAILFTGASSAESILTEFRTQVPSQTLSTILDLTDSEEQGISNLLPRRVRIWGEHLSQLLSSGKLLIPSCPNPSCSYEQSDQSGAIYCPQCGTKLETDEIERAARGLTTDASTWDRLGRALADVGRRLGQKGQYWMVWVMGGENLLADKAAMASFATMALHLSEPGLKVLMVVQIGSTPLELMTAGGEVMLQRANWYMGALPKRAKRAQPIKKKQLALAMIPTIEESSSKSLKKRRKKILKESEDGEVVAPNLSWSVEELLEVGRAAVAERDYSTAEQCFEMALKQEPANSEALHSRGMIAIFYRDFGGAQRYFSLAVNADPSDPIAANALAMIQEKLS